MTQDRDDASDVPPVSGDPVVERRTLLPLPPAGELPPASPLASTLIELAATNWRYAFPFMSLHLDAVLQLAKHQGKVPPDAALTLEDRVAMTQCRAAWDQEFHARVRGL